MLKKVFLLVVLMLSFSALSAQEISRPPFRVYLTFEDGPTEEYTTQILDTLAQYNAKATFFPNGYQIAGREAILQRIIREGHAIGNHLWEEPGYYFGADEVKIREAYQKSEDAIRAALGPELVGIYDRQVKLFRQPGGGGSPFPAINGLQVITYNWNVDGDDCGWWLDSSEPYDSDVIDNMLNTPRSTGGARYNIYQYGDGAVIALHDINRVTGRVLPVVLAELQAAGATFEALPRPWDQPGTMPVVIGLPPVSGDGISGTALRALIKDYAFVRSAPSTNAAVAFASPAPDVQVMAIGRADGWIQISKDGQTGWVYEDGLKVFGPIPSLPRAS